MTQIIGYSGHDRNVTLQFFQGYESDVAKVRKALYQRLNEYHPSISLAVKKLLEDRTYKASAPLLGELLPHILKNIVADIDPKLFEEISVQWMAAYMLTVIADNSVDTNKMTNGALIAPLHLEASKLQHQVANTKYADMFEQLTSEAVAAHIKEIKLSTKQGYINQKLAVAKDKGKIYSVLAIVFAAQASTHRETNLPLAFTDSLLLGLQMLDDVADYDADYEVGNKTVLLSKVKGSTLNNRALLKEIIASGALQDVCEITLRSLKDGFAILHTKNAHSDSNISIQDYLSDLIVEVKRLIVLIDDYEKSSGIPKKGVLTNIDNQMKIICQST